MSRYGEKPSWKGSVQQKNGRVRWGWHFAEWSGEVRNIVYSSDGKSLSVAYHVTMELMQRSYYLISGRDLWGHGDDGEALCCGGGDEGNLVDGDGDEWLLTKAIRGWGMWSGEGWRRRTAARETEWRRDWTSSPAECVGKISFPDKSSHPAGTGILRIFSHNLLK